MSRGVQPDRKLTVKVLSPHTPDGLLFSSPPSMPRTPSVVFAGQPAHPKTIIIRKELLGGGGQGKIYSGIMFSFNPNKKQDIILKLISATSKESKTHAQITESLLECSSIEAGLLRSFGTYQETDLVTGDVLTYVVMPPCDAILTECIPYIQKTATSQPEIHTTILCKYVCAMITILRTLKEIKVVHTDLKPDNMGLRANDTQYGLCAIDFGSAIIQQEFQSNTVIRNVTCTALYSAPEKWVSNNQDSPIDIFSMGQVLTHLLGDKLHHQHIFDRINESSVTNFLTVFHYAVGCEYVEARKKREEDKTYNQKTFHAKLLADVQCKTNFMDCLKLIAYQMSAILPEDRPTVALLDEALTHLKKLLPVIEDAEIEETIKNFDFNMIAELEKKRWLALPKERAKVVRMNATKESLKTDVVFAPQIQLKPITSRRAGLFARLAQPKRCLNPYKDPCDVKMCVEKQEKQRLPRWK